MRRSTSILAPELLVPGIDDPHRYSIRWVGSMLAPETGDYEFVIRTHHATRLWINDDRGPVIDAWVKSGNEIEYKTSVYLVGGRAYPLRLEFSKVKFDVEDFKTQNKRREILWFLPISTAFVVDRLPSLAESWLEPLPPTSVTLLWHRPHGVTEPIPTRFLSPDPVPESFNCTVPFPPDDRSYGWERGTAVSEAWDEATSSAAIQAAGYVVTHLNELAGTREDDKDRNQRLRNSAREFARRAFRHPLDVALSHAYVDKLFDEADEPETAVRRVALLVLKSPRFLFREVGGGSDEFDTAARLSFGLWDTIPDQELLAAASSNALSSDDQVRQQAERMLTDLRARTKLHDFLLTWLNVGSEVDLSKDLDRFPKFDAAVVADLRTSLELFLDDVLWSQDADYRRLFLTDSVLLNNRLANFYGAEAQSRDFTMVKLDNGKRAGVLTHPYLMARFSHRSETSPILRGVFLARGILGQSLRPPPQAFTPLAPELNPDLTTRERVTLQTRDATCMSCHHIINPLGFTLERFDAAGRYRDYDNGKPVDANTEYKAADGTTIKLNGRSRIGRVSGKQ